MGFFNRELKKGKPPSFSTWKKRNPKQAKLREAFEIYSDTIIGDYGEKNREFVKKQSLLSKQKMLTKRKKFWK